MGEAMALRDEDIGRIGDYVKPWLRSVVEDMIPRQEPGGVGAQLLERMVRVEEELKSQRQLMDERFGFMEHRFAVCRFHYADERPFHRVELDDRSRIRGDHLADDFVRPARLRADSVHALRRYQSKNEPDGQ